MENLNSIKKEILQKIKSAESDDNVEEIRIRELGKKGRRQDVKRVAEPAAGASSGGCQRFCCQWRYMDAVARTWSVRVSADCS